MLTEERKKELESLGEYPTTSEIKGLTNEELLYMYGNQQFYDDVIVPEMIRRSGLEEKYQSLDPDYDNVDAFMDDVYNLLKNQ